MDVKFINPFLDSVGHVFNTMLKIQPKRAEIRISRGESPHQAITALVGITGSVGGVVVLRFPPTTALQLAGRFLGTTHDAIDGEVIDAMSELVNMVAGSAKAKFELDPPLQLGLPTVVEGTSYRVKYPSKSVWLEVPYSCEAGDFTMEVTFDAK